MALADEFNPFLAYAASYAAMVEATPGSRIAPVGREGSLICAVTPFPFANFNRVTGVRLTEEEVDGAISGVMAAHEAAGVPGSWWLDPGATPVGIERALEQRGYRAQDTAPVMSMDLGELPDIDVAPGVELAFVRGRDEMREAQRMAAVGFERQAALIEMMADVYAAFGDAPEGPVRVVVATLDGLPVSSATGVTTGEVCGVFNVATLPEARGKGLGRATTLAVLHDARARGARMGVLHASPMGFGVYIRMGFRHVGDFHRFTIG